MFIAHMAPLSGADFAWDRPGSWIDVVNGRSSVLFAVCAGISLALMTRRRPETPDDPIALRRTILARSVALFVLGAVLQALGTGVAVILQTYAMCFVLALPLLRSRARTVLLAVGASLAVGPPIVLLGQAFARDGGDAIVAGVLLGAYPALTWWSVVLVGTLVGRLDLWAVRTASQLVLVGAGTAVVGYGGGVLARLALGLPVVPPGDVSPDAPVGSSGREPIVVPQGGGSLEHPEVDWSLLTSVQPHAGSAFEVLGGVGVAIAVVGFMSLVVPRIGRIAFPLVSIGRMALTLYAAHIVVIATVGQETGATEPTDTPPLEAWAVLLVVAGASLVVAPLWCRFVGRGPLERLLGRLSRSLDPSPGVAAAAR